MSQVKGHSKLGGPRVPHVPLLATLGLLLSVLLGSGCARRLDLTPTELKRIEGPDGDLKLLRVYPKKKLISLYREEEVQESYEVNKRKITERGAYRPFKRIIGKKIAGKVVARTEQNGMPVLWIAFDRGCEDTACAYGFVLSEVDRYQLFQVPFRKAFQTPTNYRRNTFKRNTLKKTKQKSLAEANEVFAVTRRSGKVLTIDLQILKDTYRPTRADVERAGGAD
ncbi:MAG: hypothetical protein JNK56_36315 [Myxococcales bacterium]|nr:hypothetical protein [Myxococcales bacterium]